MKNSKKNSWRTLFVFVIILIINTQKWDEIIFLDSQIQYKFKFSSMFWRNNDFKFERET